MNKKQLALEEIEQWIIDAGSDHVPTFGGTYEGGIQLQQVPDEIAGLLHFLLKSGTAITTYLEIGSAAGGTAYVFDHFFKPKTMVLIDDNQHPKAHVRPYVLRDIPDRIEIIGYSQEQGTVDAVKQLGIVFDFVLIDGGHSYGDVRIDAEIYTDFVKPGGLLVLHDSALSDLGIVEVVEGLKKCSEVEFVTEYVTKKHWRPCGLAVFRKVAAHEAQ